MSFEGANEQQEKKKRLESEKHEEEKAEWRERYRKKEIFATLFEKKKLLQFLKSMVERGLLKPRTARAIMAHKEVETKELEEMFTKIDAIEAIRNVEKILPNNLRLTKEEYASALKNDANRTQAIKKIEQALYFIANSHSPRSSSPVSAFLSFFAVLDTNLRTVQEHTIDLKRSLL